MPALRGPRLLAQLQDADDGWAAPGLREHSGK